MTTSSPAASSPVTSQAASRTAASRRPRSSPLPVRGRLGLVCAGGGVTGAIYEIGALAALEDRIDKLSLVDFDVFVGVSAGSYLGALLANRISPGVMYRNVTRSASSRTDLDDLQLFRVNLSEIAGRLAAAPVTILEAAWEYYRNRRETTLTDLVQALGELLPSGVFHNQGMEEWMSRWLAAPGRTDDFRKLEKALRIVAVELDTGDTRAFGAPGSEAVPISKAVRASCAIPGLYQPVKIEGREYIDGGVKKTAHISLAIRERCGLVVCINPLVPYRFRGEQHHVLLNGQMGQLATRGMPSILEQVFRVTLHSRMRYGMERYRRENPETDILVFEPRAEDLPRFMSNIMRTSGRIRIAEYAYRTTMQTIDADFPRLSKVFARHGIRLRPQAPEKSRTLRRAQNSELLEMPGTPTPRRLAASLETLEDDLERYLNA